MKDRRKKTDAITPQKALLALEEGDEIKAKKILETLIEKNKEYKKKSALLK